MWRVLEHLRWLKEAVFRVPVFCAGDIFHKWNSPPELINFALKYLPVDDSIAGQHDLPHHNYKDVSKSAYWTLVKAGKIRNVPAKGLRFGRGERKYVYGFGWKKKIIDPLKSYAIFQLALVHRYVWEGKANAFATVNQNTHISGLQNKLKSFDAVAFGDNHQPFMYGATRINCGSLMCRNADQKSHKPQVGILYSDGIIKPYQFDTSQDKWLSDSEIKAKVQDAPDFKKLANKFKEMSSDIVNFSEVLIQSVQGKDCQLTWAQKEILRSIIDKMENQDVK